MSDFESKKDYSVTTKLFDNAEILFVITPSGEHLIPVRVLADYFGIPLKSTNQTITRNRPLFVDKIVKLKIEDAKALGHMMLPSEDLRLFECFTLAGALQYVNALSHSKYSDDRREAIIKMKNWLVDLGASVIQGKPLGQVDRGEVRVISSELTKKIKDLLKEKIVSKYEDGKDHSHIYQNEFKMLNRVAIGEHQRGMKETLNAAGLQVHNTGQVADIALLHADVLNYEKRKSAVAATVNMVHASVDRATLRLTDEERGRVKRNLPKSQSKLLGSG